MSTVFEKAYSEKKREKIDMMRIENAMGKILDPLDPLEPEPFPPWTQPGRTTPEALSDDSIPVEEEL